MASLVYHHGNYTIFQHECQIGFSVSASFTADGLMRILYLGTLPQVFKNILKSQTWLVCSILKSSQVFGIFGKL